jgi:dUTP pyrophosphatase
MRLSVQRLRSDARIPARAHPGDAGLDLYAVEARTLAPGQRAMVPTGIAIALPEGHAGLVVPRSGLAARNGIAIVNAPGLIDEGYRGEVKVLLLNTDPTEPFAIDAGDRIAQLVVVRVDQVEVHEADDLEATGRGAGGFGSSGR